MSVSGGNSRALSFGQLEQTTFLHRRGIRFFLAARGLISRRARSGRRKNCSRAGVIGLQPTGLSMRPSPARTSQVWRTEAECGAAPGAVVDPVGLATVKLPGSPPQERTAWIPIISMLHIPACKNTAPDFRFHVVPSRLLHSHRDMSFRPLRRCILRRHSPPKAADPGPRAGLLHPPYQIVLCSLSPALRL